VSEQAYQVVAASEPGGENVRRIEITRNPTAVRVEFWSGEPAIFGRFGNGRRWLSSGYVSRDFLEQRRGLGRGYLAAIEDLFDAAEGMSEAVRKEVAAFREELMDQVEARHRDNTEAMYSTFFPGRHEALALWRSRSAPAAVDPPDVLQGVRHIRRLDPCQPCYVYFLVSESEVVYVGKTTRLAHRIEAHMKDKTFDDVWYLEVDRQSLNETEQAYIRRFRPKYNVQCNRDER